MNIENIMTKNLLLYYFEGLDESVLKLNSYISESGFEFVKYDLKEFEEKFLSLFRDEGDYKERIYDDDGISDVFVNAIVNSSYFNADEIVRINKYVIFLIDIENKYLADELDIRIKNLISKLKLFKSGHIKLISAFDITEKIRWHFPDFPTTYAPPSKRRTYQVYTLSDSDLSELNYFKEELLIPGYLELAFNSFLEYYNFEDEKIKFIMLMIALESIFNKSGQDPIAHIISRHVALIISKTRESFLKQYDEIKTLYNIRSIIVHGKEKKESKDTVKDISKDVLKLENIVRSVLKKLIWYHDFDLNMPKDKIELWKYLNAKGFTG